MRLLTQYLITVPVTTSDLQSAALLFLKFILENQKIIMKYKCIMKIVNANILLI